MVVRVGARARAADVHWGRDGAAALAAAR